MPSRSAHSDTVSSRIPVRVHQDLGHRGAGGQELCASCVDAGQPGAFEARQRVDELAQRGELAGGHASAG